MKRLVWTAALVLACARFAAGQTPSQPVTPTAQPTPAGPVAGWQNGAFIQSANGDYRLLFGLTAQVDGRFSLSDTKPTPDTFTLRKARPTLSGRLTKYFEFRFMPDFGGNTTVVQDAYIDFRLTPTFRVRTGKGKTPVGYEFLISDGAVLFPERALVTNLVPFRDQGIEALGELAGGRVTYVGGVFNGIPDGANSTADDVNSGKDLAGNVVVQPFRGSTTHAPAVRGLGFHLGGSTGNQTGALPVYRTPLALQTFFNYAATSQADGRRNRVSPTVFYYHKAVGAFAEFARSTQAVTRATTSRDITNHAWAVTGSWLVTGETASQGLPTPAHPFDPSAGHWGALELLGRYSELCVDQAAFDAGFAASGASRSAKAVTVGANWYPVQYVKYYLAYEHTAFEGPTPRPSENTVVFRFQVSF